MFIVSDRGDIWLPLEKCKISFEKTYKWGKATPDDVYQDSRRNPDSTSACAVRGFDLIATLIGDFELEHELVLNRTIPGVAEKEDMCEAHWDRGDDEYEIEFEDSDYMYQYCLKQKEYQLATFELFISKPHRISNAGNIINDRFLELEINNLFELAYSRIRDAIADAKNDGVGRIAGFSKSITLLEPKEEEKSKVISTWDIPERTKKALSSHGILMANDLIGCSEESLSKLRNVSKEAAHMVLSEYEERRKSWT